MEWVESAAFGFLLSAGCSRDPMDFPGLSNFTCEMAQRGAGDRDSRQFVEALEDLGVDRSAAVSNGHTSFGGATLATNLYEALDIYADILRDPHLPERQMDEGLLVCLQELRTIKDDLSQRVMMQLRARQYPDPWGRSAYGTEKALRSISIHDIQRHHQQYYCPNESIPVWPAGSNGHGCGITSVSCLRTGNRSNCRKSWKPPCPSGTCISSMNPTRHTSASDIRVSRMQRPITTKPAAQWAY